MANFWIYRNKLGQTSESLDDVANDLWPIYISKGDMPINKYTNQEIEYLEDYLEDQENKNEEENQDENNNSENIEIVNMDDEILVNSSDKDEIILNSDKDFKIYKESSSYMTFVSDIESMLSLPYDRIYNGLICYVESLEGIENIYDYKDGLSGDDYTNYFILDNVEYSSFVGYPNPDIICCGWRNIRESEFISENLTKDAKQVLYLESLVTNMKGNNPHNGKGSYDNGEAYFNRFKQLFYDALKGDNRDLIINDDLMGKIENFGFTLSARPDNQKCYFFGDVIYKNNNIETINSDIVFHVPSSGTSRNSEAATSVMNTKHLSIRFFSQGLNGDTEIKNFKNYINDVVMVYLEEMIPATTIVEYLFDSEESSFKNMFNYNTLMILGTESTDAISDNTIYYDEDTTFFNNGVKY
jgi:hypothetical protein